MQVIQNKGARLAASPACKNEVRRRHWRRAPLVCKVGKDGKDSTPEGKRGESAVSEDEQLKPRSPSLPDRSQRLRRTVSKGKQKRRFLAGPRREYVLASSLVNSGLLGTMAVSGALLAKLNIFGNFRGSLEDVQYGLTGILPLLVLNAILFLPTYTTWELPEPESIIQQKEATSGTVSHQVNQQASTSTPGEPAEPQGAVRVKVNKPAKPRSTLSLWKDSMHLAQGFLVTKNPLRGLPLPAELFALFVKALGNELLVRGLVLNLLARWLSDRLWESGMVDMDDLIHFTDSYSIPCVDGAKWGAVFFMASFSAGLLLREAIRALNNRTMVLDLGSLARGTGQPKVVEDHPDVFSALYLSTTIVGLRGLIQMTLLNAVYVSSGSLTASLAASLLNQAVLGMLQRYGIERTRQRSQQLSEELAQLNEKLRKIMQKQKEEKAVAEAREVEEVTNTPKAAVDEGLLLTHSMSTPAAGSVEIADGGAGSHGQETPPEEEPSGATRATEGTNREAQSSLDRTIFALDQLLGESSRDRVWSGTK